MRATRALTSVPFGVNLNMEFPQEAHLEGSLKEGVPIILFFWKDPGDLVRRAKDAGAIVTYSVGSVEATKRAVDPGIDVIVAQG